MNNITYNIIESDIRGKKCCNDNILEYVQINKKSKINDNVNERYAREIDYELNYTLKYLTAISEFYGIKRGKLNKKQIIEKILDFEFDMCIENISVVKERKRLFENFIELKNDNFFSKLILSNFT